MPSRLRLRYPPDDPIAISRQSRGRILANIRPVFYYKDSPSAARGMGEFRSCCCRYFLLPYPGQLNLKCRSLSRFAVNRDRASALRHDSLQSRQPEHGSFTKLLRGEEGFEDAQPRLFVDARPLSFTASMT